jgi:hypothetical protein
MSGPPADAGARFRFAQFEFPWALGPDDGRYVVRGDEGEASHVVVLSTLGAPERRLLRRKGRARDVEPEPPPAAVTTGRATVIDAASVDEAAGDAWLAAQRDGDATAAIGEALAALNKLIAAHRLATADDGVRDATATTAIAIRVGHGRGEEVADGRWTAAAELPADRPASRPRRRAAALRPQERLAALLAGREIPMACEELTLRARSDLDAARNRQAALQLRVALEAAIAELARDSRAAVLATRIEELREERATVGDAANAALAGELDDETIAAVAHALGRVEAALRARAAEGGFAAPAG